MFRGILTLFPLCLVKFGRLDYKLVLHLMVRLDYEIFVDFNDLIYIAVRVDAYTGHLLMSEQRDLSYFEADAGLHFGSQFDTKNVLENVWSVFSSLKDLNLKPGSYLLQHSEGIAVNVLEKFEGEESSTDVYDLKVCYDIDSNSTVELDVNDLWVPLDPWTVMPIQRILARPPLTFEPEGGTMKDHR